MQFSVDGVAVSSPVAVHDSGVATLTYQVLKQAGAHSVSLAFTNTNTNFNSSATTKAATLEVTRENVSIAHTGGSLRVVKVNLTLQATVWDGAAAGYPGSDDAEKSTGKTIGDITKTCRV